MGITTQCDATYLSSKADTKSLLNLGKCIGKHKLHFPIAQCKQVTILDNSKKAVKIKAKRPHFLNTNTIYLHFQVILSRAQIFAKTPNDITFWKEENLITMLNKHQKRSKSHQAWPFYSQGWMDTIIDT